ncbi:hypothetical protein LR48_Vigan44s000600 [Vigna angularis]|uniref:Uncharacterized protein n=1 Tax=Phaseolus angularis TaxID=3914 RepID=A0A0L9T355_PHAAN|nr:hypothetical protein LR48_Vigan44s000600 [Vigna angularis]
MCRYKLLSPSEPSTHTAIFLALLESRVLPHATITIHGRCFVTGQPPSRCDFLATIRELVFASSPSRRCRSHRRETPPSRDKARPPWPPRHRTVLATFFHSHHHLLRINAASPMSRLHHQREPSASSLDLHQIRGRGGGGSLSQSETLIGEGRGQPRGELPLGATSLVKASQ